MTENAVRIPPVDVDRMTPEQADAIGGWTHLVFSRVIVNSPRLYRSFIAHLEDLIARTTLTPRDRQIVCLRMLELCGDTYEKTHHIVISRKSGLSDDEIEAVIDGDGAALSGINRTLIRAVDELYRDQFVSDATWVALADRYDREQLMDIVFLSGCYQTMAMLTKTFGIELEPDLESFNALRSYA